MAREATATLQFQMVGSYKNVLTDAVAPVVQFGQSSIEQVALANGTVEDAIDRVWASKARALSSGASETFDLSAFTGIDLGAGSAKDQLGQSAGFVDIVGIMVKLALNAAGVLTLDTASPANPWNNILDGTLKLRASTLKPAYVLLVNPDDPGGTVDATHKNLTITAVGGAVASYDIYILGRSA